MLCVGCRYATQHCSSLLLENQLSLWSQPLKEIWFKPYYLYIKGRRRRAGKSRGGRTEGKSAGNPERSQTRFWWSCNLVSWHSSGEMEKLMESTAYFYTTEMETPAMLRPKDVFHFSKTSCLNLQGWWWSPTWLSTVLLHSLVVLRQGHQSPAPMGVNVYPSIYDHSMAWRKMEMLVISPHWASTHNTKKKK